jgi:hypothetical protein
MKGFQSGLMLLYYSKYSIVTKSVGSFPSVFSKSPSWHDVIILYANHCVIWLCVFDVEPEEVIHRFPEPYATAGCKAATRRELSRMAKCVLLRQLERCG